MRATGADRLTAAGGIAYSVSVVLAHFQIRPGVLAFFRHATETTIKTQWRRVRLKTGEDVDKAYSLLQEYLDQPSLAASVQELVLDVPVRHTPYCLPGEENEAQQEGKVDSEHNGDEQDLLTRSSEPVRQGAATGAGTDDDDVVVIVSHEPCPSSSHNARSRRWFHRE